MGIDCIFNAMHSIICGVLLIYFPPLMNLPKLTGRMGGSEWSWKKLCQNSPMHILLYRIGECPTPIIQV